MSDVRFDIAVAALTRIVCERDQNQLPTESAQIAQAALAKIKTLTPKKACPNCKKIKL